MFNCYFQIVLALFIVYNINIAQFSKMSTTFFKLLPEISVDKQIKDAILKEQ
tara:strand:- start:609 stop:764 length:156 start_codon:yes stop_codon:yes gene_type:complete